MRGAKADALRGENLHAPQRPSPLRRPPRCHHVRLRPCSASSAVGITSGGRFTDCALGENSSGLPLDVNRVVAKLTPGFDSEAYGNCKSEICLASPPTPDNSEPALDPDIATTIQQVFEHSSPNFQTEMCKLDHIYIDTDPMSVNRAPWGMRERARNGRWHIGIPLTTLNIFSDYSSLETSIINSLLGTAWTDIVAAAPNAREMMMAAILAHEMGHIVWWALPVPPGICNGDDFFLSWRSVIRSPARGFHQFGKEIAGNMPIEGYKFSTIKNDVAAGDLRKLSKVYSSGRWPSLFGFVAPDEDFIETYKLITLSARTSSPLTNLWVTIPTSNPVSIDMVSMLNDVNTTLNLKQQWINGNSCVGTP